MNKNFDYNNIELPCNITAEKVVLGIILTRQESINFISPLLKIEAFFLPQHQIIYKAALILHGEGKNIDYLTITNWLTNHGLLQSIQDVNEIMDIIIQSTPVSYLYDYIELINEKYLRRCLINMGYYFITTSLKTEISSDHLLLLLEKEFHNLTETKKTDGLKSASTILREVIGEIEQKLLYPSPTGFLSSFYELDAILQGFHRSDLIILAGRPSMGKTALALNLAKRISLNSNIQVVFFSLEMSRQQIIYRLLADETDILQNRLKSGRVSKREWEQLNSYCKNSTSLNLDIDDTPDLTVLDLRAKLQTLKYKYEDKLGLIVIDYLQLIEQKTKIENRVQEISKITRTLKKLAREFNVAILVLSQLSRNVENRMNKRPILADLRDSGSIEQDADIVLMLYRDEYYNPKNSNSEIMEIIVAKHRNGALGKAQINFDSKNLHFSNINKL